MSHARASKALTLLTLTAVGLVVGLAAALALTVAAELTIGLPASAPVHWSLWAVGTLAALGAPAATAAVALPQGVTA